MNKGGVLSGQTTETSQKGRKKKIDVYCHDQVKNNYITSYNLLNHAHGLLLQPEDGHYQLMII